MTHGHMLANLDPLELEKEYASMASLSEKFKFPDQSLRALVDYKTYGFTDADLDRDFYVDAPMLAGLP